jgi:sec-independent protein translocase protein TatC
MLVESLQPTIKIHLLELKKRLIRIISLFLILFAALYPFAGNIYNLITQPLQAVLPNNSTIISTDITSAFFTPLKLNAYIVILIILPIALFEIWKYVSPALLNNEKKLIRPLIISSILLFYIGCAVTYECILPILYNFFVSSAPASVTVMSDMNNLLNFTFVSVLMTGLVFQIPIIMIACTSLGLVEIGSLQAGRRFAIVASFIVAMIIAPDVFLQFIFAVPIYVLYEMGILFSKLTQSKTYKSETFTL